MALKIVHYALIALAVAICIGYLYWRWRKVNNQNKALEAELRLVQPYNNLPAVPERVIPEVVQMRPSPLQFQPVDLAAAKAATANSMTAAAAPVSNNSPPVLTPPANSMSAINEEEDDEEENVGIPPIIPPTITMTPVTFIIDSTDPHVDRNHTTNGVTNGITNGIVEITEADEVVPAPPIVETETVIEDKVIEDKVPAPKTARRRRKDIN